MLASSSSGCKAQGWISAKEIWGEIYEDACYKTTVKPFFKYGFVEQI